MAGQTNKYDYGRPEENTGGEEGSLRDEAYLVGEEPEYPAADYPSTRSPDAIQDEAREGVDARPLEEAVASPYDDLEQMYASSDKVKKPSRLTIQEGLPEPDSKRTLLVPLLVVLLIFAGLASIPLLMKKTLINRQGGATEVSLVKYLVEYSKMTPQQRALQSLDPQERQFLTDHDRVAALSGASFDYFAQVGLWPESVAVLVERGDIPGESAEDSWGHEIRLIEKNDEIEVRSAGADGRFNTPDDVALHKGDWSIPPRFELERIEKALAF